MIRGAAALAVAIAAAAAPAAHGCSVLPSYRVPTSLDLAAKGDIIVVAEVTGERKGSSTFDTAVLARPIQLLKGSAPPGLIEIPRSYLETDSRGTTPSAPRELRAPHPDSGSGGCVRYTFRKGMKLVLFLERDAAGRYAPFRAPFSRDAEDVTGPDALWVKAVREYAAISQTPLAGWNDRLRHRAAILRARRGDPDAQAIARDMAIELNERARPRQLIR